ncbi:CDK5 and ABL1 enzyme substrate 2 Interactor with CDK3 2 [Channa argus]|uniref:CDK5 and ABL1 enzyme substrate 2 Interactor with CDK3 2 n=1 Tax=Channa argus TaxID=215402 RepID=A0A6G1Q440_CHAAH|nr:CDK5 and ABL1 enzyme substrate 2 Interactor with CDK3 2 [Channa argus]
MELILIGTHMSESGFMAARPIAAILLKHHKYQPLGGIRKVRRSPKCLFWTPKKSTTSIERNLTLFRLSNHLRVFADSICIITVSANNCAEGRSRFPTGYPLRLRLTATFQTRMATAVCGLQPTGSKSNTAKTNGERRRKVKDSRRRQAALLFLNNISLDGRPQCHLDNGKAENKTAEEPRLRGRDGAAVVPPPAAKPAEVGPVSEPAASGSGSSSSFPDVVSPTRPSLVMSSGQVAVSAVGANDVFLESGSACETPLSPVPTVHQPCSRVRSMPAVLSPSPAGNLVDSRQRLRNVSGSPGPKVPKKVHFIKSMRPYDTRGCSFSTDDYYVYVGCGETVAVIVCRLTHHLFCLPVLPVSCRIMLICAKRSLYAVFSVLPYGHSANHSDLNREAQRQRLSSVVAADLLPSLEGLELGASDKTVSYAQFLYPTNALVRQKSSSGPDNSTSQTPQSRLRGNGQRNFTPARQNNTVAQEASIEEASEYDPNLLSDPQWPCGRHKRVLTFASYVVRIYSVFLHAAQLMDESQLFTTTVIEYVKPSDLKKDMNETFKEKFPHIKLTLSKIRSLKREMRAVSEECTLQPVTIAMAFVYFEKLVLQGRLNKQNRKLVAAACVLLAAKISSDLRKTDVNQLIDKLEERFRINRRELIPLEFPVLVALEMGLYLPESMVMPHYRRLVQQG